MGERRTQVVISALSELTRYGLRSMLLDVAGTAAVEVRADPREAAASIRAGAGTTLVIGLAAPPDQLLECVTAARQRGVPIMLVLPPDAGEALLTRAAALRADGFLDEGDLTRGSVARAFARLADGETPIPDALARGLLARIGRLARESADRSFLLTAREREALRLLALGLSNKEIAGRMRISLHGAKRHVAGVMAKLNCPNRTAAVTVGLHHGLVDNHLDGTA